MDLLLEHVEVLSHLDLDLILLVVELDGQVISELLSLLVELALLVFHEIEPEVIQSLSFMDFQIFKLLSEVLGLLDTFFKSYQSFLSLVVS